MNTRSILLLQYMKTHYYAKQLPYYITIQQQHQQIQFLKTYNCPRNIIWFNSPYSCSVASKAGKRFLLSLDKHFPRSNTLLKIFKRNTLKVSYSCMNSVKSVISSYNARVLSKKTNPPGNKQHEKACNCIGKNDCPLQGNCLTSGVIS